MEIIIEVLAYSQQTEACPECKGSGWIRVYQGELICDESLHLIESEEKEYVGEDKCKSCGGSGTLTPSSTRTTSGTKEFTEKVQKELSCADDVQKDKSSISLVVRRFKTCGIECTISHNWEKELSKEEYKNITPKCHLGKCFKGRREQTFKVGEKYKFALQTEKCTECRYFFEENIIQKCDFVTPGECSFEPRIIEGTVKSSKISCSETSKEVSTVVREEGIPFTKYSEGVTMDRQSLNQGKWLNEHTNPEEVMKLLDGEYILLPNVELVNSTIVSKKKQKVEVVYGISTMKE